MNVTSWINKQIRTKSDFEPASKQSQEIQKNLDELADRVDELKTPVEVSLEGSYDDLSIGRKFMLGAAGGAVAGGVLGATHGLLSPIGDKLELDVAWNTQSIYSDSLKVNPIRNQISGLSSQVTSEGVVDVMVKGGVRYDFEAEIVNSKVGEYQTPGDVSVKRTESSNTTISGLVGIGIGAGLGLAATGAVMALKKLRGNEEQNQQGQQSGADDSLVNGQEMKRMAAMGAVGVAGGAGVGALSGWMESNRAAGLSQEVTWETPIMERTDIGTVPESASILIRQDLDYGDSLKNSQIYRDPGKFDLEDHMSDSVGRTVQGEVPDKNLIGQIKMEEHSKTYTAEANTTVLASALGGALVGGVVGVAAGVCYNTLKRMIEA